MTLAVLATVRRSWDSDAGAYIKAVEAADGQQLEPGVAQAINQFVLGCKADGIWTPIKAACILMGARTLTGALTPLAGSAPTNNNFVSGDYARKTGLKGNGSTKSINSNRANNADGQNDNHAAAYVTAVQSTGGAAYIGGADATTQAGAYRQVGRSGADTTNIFGRNMNTTATVATVGKGGTTGLVGTARTASATYILHSPGTDETVTMTSATTEANNVFVFCRQLQFYTDARIAFYSVGAYLALSSLDTRVSNLYTQIGNALT